MKRSWQVAGQVAGAALLFLVSSAAPAVASEGAGIRWVEDFSGCQTGAFPPGWEARGGNGQDVYQVQGTGECYLQARAHGTAITAAKAFEYDLKAYPFLVWQWRALELPKGGDERYKESGDSAAAVYVIFQGRFRPDNIKYVWSASLPVGATTESPYNSKTKIVVLRNQASPKGQWLTEKVNVYEDYKRLFGREPEAVQAVAVMSDSDNTHSRAEADYKRIHISAR